MFWPDADDEAARGALRRTLSALRTAIGPAGFEIGRSQVALDPSAASVDLVAFERLAASTRPAELEAAAALARGPFLAGFALRDSPAFDDWQAGRAVRVERSVAALLDRLATARSAAGDAAGAIEAASRRVELDPLDELGHRRLIELLALAGDRTGAIRQYRELVAVFDRELGVAPLRETTELYDAVREDRLERGAPPDVSPVSVEPRRRRRDGRSGRDPARRARPGARHAAVRLACLRPRRARHPARGRGRHRQDAPRRGVRRGSPRGGRHRPRGTRLSG